MNASGPPIAIGDTFCRVGDDGGAWEATRYLTRGGWRLDRGSEVHFAMSAQLQDAALWARVWVHHVIGVAKRNRP